MKVIEEASTLGLKPGQWPETLYYKCRLYRRGNPEIRNGELVSVTYGCEDRILIVLND